MPEMTADERPKCQSCYYLISMSPAIACGKPAASHGPSGWVCPLHGGGEIGVCSKVCGAKAYGTNMKRQWRCPGHGGPKGVDTDV